jgi:SNF2 family DNA or RNA helicase
VNTTLHALWMPATAPDSRGELCLWAEGAPRPASRRGKTRFDHPFALGASQILHLLWQLWRELPSARLAETARKIPLVLPSLDNRPLRSAEPVIRDSDRSAGRAPSRRRKSVDPVLQVWRADALVLPPQQALTFLVQVPADVNWIALGPSARFWQRAAYLAASAVVRGQFLPSADERGNGVWQALLMDPEAQARLACLAQTMPASARAIAQPLPPAHELLNDFVAATVHAYVSHSYTPGRSPFYDPYAYAAKPHQPQPADFWWLDLFPRARHNLRTLKRPAEQSQFAQRVREWALPSYAYLTSPLRVAFRLEPPTQAAPTAASEVADWRLSFHLQPKDQPETLWAAGEVWDNAPQPEMPAVLRAGLAQAARVYPRLATALENAFPAELWLNVAEAVRFLETVAEELNAQGFGVLVPAWWKDRRRKLSASLALKQSEGSGLLGLDTLVDFDWKLAVGDTTLTPQELEQLAQAKTALVQVRGEWVQFDPLEVQAALRLAQRHQKSGGKLSLPEALSLALAGPGEWEGLDVEAVRLDAWFEQLLERLNDHRRLEHLRQPESFVGHLRPYQENGLSWLAFMRAYGFGACLADDMGLGKTIQLLALLTKDFDEAHLTEPVLLVCPTTVVNNWVREAERFAPRLKCYAHHGPQRLKNDRFVAGVREHHVVITSYALLPRDAEFLRQVAWGGVVLDEAHNIKNPVTKQAQIARQLPAAYRVALTGTPLENRLQDLWSIMHFLNPGYLGSAESFQRRFAGPIERIQDERAARRLRAVTGPFILRRLKTDRTIIQDLPPKNEMKELCGLTKEQAALYKAVVNESLRQIAAADGIRRRGIILATLTRLKQVCNHPRHLLGDHSALRHRSGKLNRLTEMLEQALAEEDRVLIFTQYAEMGELLREHLTETFGETLYLHGGTPARKRAELIARFQDGGPRLFVLSLKAGGAGINLTRANRVFHFDRWWNPAVENQATDRAFRIGQSRAVQVHKMICRGTLEEHIDELITRKLALAEQIVGSGEGWLTELSTDDLRELLVLRREALDE